MFLQGFPGGDALGQGRVVFLSLMLSFEASTARGWGSTWFVQTWE